MQYQFKNFLFLILLFSGTRSFAQFSGRGGGQNLNLGHFYGKILDASTSKPIDAASVQLLQTKFDTATKKKKEIIVAGMLTDKKGEFSLENLPVIAQYKLVISAIGFKPIEQKVQFEINKEAAKSGDYSSLLSGVDKDLGNIKLEIDAQQLQNVTVTSGKSLLTMSIDRKVYNVEKDISTAGGSAIDVMKNVPSVSVDLDGNLTMRNASPQIFVDGRPTTMTLEQIPADAISSVEIITNPSAKFDASGGGAGILNIVMKKNRKAGYNGNIRAGIDSRAKPNVGGDINIKQQKVNFFASGQFAMRKPISTNTTTRTDFLSDATAHLLQNNKPIGNGIFGFVRAGIDYLLDNRNTLTVSGNFSNGQFKGTDMLNVARDTVYTSSINSDFGNRSSNSKRVFKNYGSTVSFKHNFTKPNKNITADINYNYSKNNSTSDYATQYFYTDGNPKNQATYEQSKGGGINNFFTAQMDYEDPISKTMKIEAGARIALRSFSSYNDNYIRDNTSGNYFTVPLLNNEYEFKDRVIAAYTTFAHQIKKFSYQLGARIESSTYTGSLINKAQTFSNEFPFSIFPSAFLTYKINDQQDLQLNYSRKINRPNFFQLIPYIDFTDSLNLSKGNPDLIPEFTNLLELSYQNQLAKGHNILTSVYFKNTNNLITRYQYRDQNPNPDKLDSIIMTTFANANKSYTFGFELTSKNKITKWWDVTININVYNATIKAGNLVNGTDRAQTSWFGKLNNSFKLPKNFTAQLTTNYQAKTLLPQNSGGSGGMRNFGGGGGGFGQQLSPTALGYIDSWYEFDFSIKKEFMKNNAASVSLQVNDIFRTKLYKTHSESSYFIQDNTRRQDPQLVRLNFNWRFGKIDVNLFKRKNLKGDAENLQNIQNSSGQ
ncbi:TonB-dependent receptor [Ferruginibacter lapsinanis]|uniref:outer membrane beta-barrel family protein n=1 Tax=Ferruginibacter lapsinanis TaxID=563172 RepID=UPI001E373970|nr:outer membrane beta-barrel family protein [Ferruginibacter lapsinanis]UEG49058.1 TonB-dependent receptor [Ferruginibacter lapsinanis]